MLWGRTIRGRFGSSLTLVDSRDHPLYRSWVLMSVGDEDYRSARVPLTRKGLLALRGACDEALRRDDE
jgi:hypothetical protein